MLLKPHAGLTKTLRILLMITIAVTTLAVLAGVYDYYSYANLPPNFDPDTTILPSDAVTALVGLIQFVLAIVTGITFLRWIYRTNRNLRALSGEQMVFTPGWSVGWYFVPIANLFKPYQVMKEIWQVSHKNRATTHSIIGWWWALWLISNVLGRVALKLVLRAEDIAGYVASAMAYIVSDGMDVIVSIVTLTLVTRIGIAYSTNIVEPAGPAYGGFAPATPPPLT